MDQHDSDLEPVATSVSKIYSRLGLLDRDESSHKIGPSRSISPAPYASRRSQKPSMPRLRIVTDHSITAPNLPELLARDLEVSSTLFALQDMTAGLPPPELATAKSTSHHHCLTPLQQQPYRRCTAPLPLSAIQETGACSDIGNSNLGLQYREEGKHQARGLYQSLMFSPYVELSRSIEVAEDEDEDDVRSTGSPSCSSAPSSDGLELPSIRFGEQSVITAATSLSSASLSAVSHKAMAPLGTPFLPPLSSNQQQTGRITPPSMCTGVDMVSYDANTKRLSRSLSGKRLVMELRPDNASKTQPPGARRVSLSDFGPRNSPNLQPDGLSSAAVSLQLRKTVAAGVTVDPATARPSYSSWRQPVVNPNSSVEDSMIESDFDSYEDEHGADYNATRRFLPLRAILARSGPMAREFSVTRGRQPTARPLSSHDNVQTWLNTSVNPQAHSRLSDESATRGPPLPPDVLETLRVSTSCFPDTVLLTSSLSVETIRSYGRKVKRPSIEPPPTVEPRLSSRSGGSSDTAQPNKKWSLSRILPKKGPSRLTPPSLAPSSLLPTIKKRHQLDSEFDSLMSAPLPWSPLRNVFGPGVSDYLLDALYAHLVAYNYISALCPLPTHFHYRTPMRSTGTAGDDAKDIPRKAASLLGLSDPDIGLALSPCTRPCQYNQPQQPSDGTLRALKAALGRCIGQLVMTLRIPTQDQDDDEPCGEKAILDKAQESSVDQFFVRSLCEIVRCCEAAT